MVDGIWLRLLLKRLKTVRGMLNGWSERNVKDEYDGF